MSGPTAPAASLPLSLSWREWLRHDDWCDRGEPLADCRASFDAIVIGSGYGGSVAALRLAGKGWRVLVLERGSEYLPGEFPNDFSLLPKFARLNVPGEGVPIGRATGLLEVHLGQGMVGITGNGLGGGSLVNAGVLMQPDADVFAQPAWPEAPPKVATAIRRRLSLPSPFASNFSTATARFSTTWPGSFASVSITR